MAKQDKEQESSKKRKLSTKRGLASSAEKEASTRHGFGPDPAARPVAGADGKPGTSMERGSDPIRKPAPEEGGLVDTAPESEPEPESDPSDDSTESSQKG